MADPPLLHATGLRKTWPGGKRLFTLERLALPAGTVTVVTGANGAGKSTLLGILAGFTPADTGSEVAWDGTAGAWPRPGRDVTLLHQHPYLFHGTVAGNLDYVLRLRTRPGPTAADLLRQVGMAGMAGQPAHELSGGECRRLALARTLATEARLVLLDEPTANLDATGTELAFALIRQLAAQGRAVLLAAQAQDLAATWSDCPQLVIDAPAPQR